MPLELVQHKAGVVEPGTEFTVEFDVQPAADHLLVCAVNSSSFLSMTSEGWAQIEAVDNLCALYLFAKVAGADEPAAVTVTLNASDRAAMVVAEFSGNMTEDVVDVSASNNPGSNDDEIASGTTDETSQADELAVAAFGCPRNLDPAGAVASYSDGFEEVAQIGSSGGDAPLVAMAVKSLDAPGAVSVTATLSVTEPRPLGVIATFKAAEAAGGGGSGLLLLGIG